MFRRKTAITSSSTAIPSSSQASAVDYSLFGGAETLPPSMRIGRNDLSLSSSKSSLTSLQSSSESDVENCTREEETSATEYSDTENDLGRVDAKVSASRKVGPESAGLAWSPQQVEPALDGTDFLWMMTEEPHRTRRTAIMKAHPEVKKLMGAEPLTKYVVLFVLFVQLLTAYSLRHTPVLSLPFLAATYIIGGTANQNTFLGVHEITHNLAFKGVRSNRLFAILANLPIGVPFAMMFKKYHIEHHKFLGVDGIDTDLPSRLEMIVLRTVLGKAFFASFQIFFYALRPGFIRQQSPTRWIFLNWLVQLSFNTLVVKYWGWHSMLYFLISSHMAGSLHPCAGHFIAEHYLFEGLNQETWSYYGPLNILAYNVGYHNEHHDFPSVPWTRLPALHEMAKEFYDPLPSHQSWPMVTIKFIFDPTIGLWSRGKRLDKTGSGTQREKEGDIGGGDVKDGIAGGLRD